MIIEAECSTLHRPQVTRPSCNPISQPCRARLASDVLLALPGSHFNGPRLPAAGELDRELFSFFPAFPPGRWRMKRAEIISACSVSTGILIFGILARSRNFQDASPTGVGVPTFLQYFLILTVVSLSS